MTSLKKTAANRWVILAAAFIVMMFISIYQYSWFLFSYAIQREYSWSLSAVSFTFTIFAITVTFIQPLSGYIADKIGPRIVANVAAVLVGTGLIMSSYSAEIYFLYIFYGLGGIGVGMLYGISTSSAIKWFPDRRGFATGVIVFGFGAGTAILNFIIERLIEFYGISGCFKILGILVLVILLPLSFMYRFPIYDNEINDQNLQKNNYSYNPKEMLKTSQWYILYTSFISTVSIVLILGAQMKNMASDMNLPKTYFSLAMILFPLGNGLSRVISGYISDKLGREKTMVLFFGALSLTLFCFYLFHQASPILFVFVVFIAALLGGSPFALYPSIIGDYYGIKYATANYGITYTAKAWAGLIAGWLSGYIVSQYGSYDLIILIVSILSLLAAIVSHPYILKKPKK